MKAYLEAMQRGEDTVTLSALHFFVRTWGKAARGLVDFSSSARRSSTNKKIVEVVSQKNEQQLDISEQPVSKFNVLASAEDHHRAGSLSVRYDTCVSRGFGVIQQSPSFADAASQPLDTNSARRVFFESMCCQGQERSMYAVNRRKIFLKILDITGNVRTNCRIYDADGCEFWSATGVFDELTRAV